MNQAKNFPELITQETYTDWMWNGLERPFSNHPTKKENPQGRTIHHSHPNPKGGRCNDPIIPNMPDMTSWM